MADLPNLAAPDENRTTVQARPNGGGGAIPAAPTDTPGLQVPEFIPRHANMEAAAEVQRILGLAGSTARDIGDQLVAKKNAKDAAQGSMDEAAGSQNAQMFKNSQAYHASWSMAGAKSAATQLSQQMTDGVNQMFTDPSNPPTLDEVHQKLEGIISGAVIGPDGKPVGFGTPEAQLHVASILGKTRDEILAQAVGKIKTDTDTKLVNTSISNYVTDGLARLSAAGPFQTDATRKVQQAQSTIDPLAPLPDPTASQAAGQAITPAPVVQAAGGDKGFAPALATVLQHEGTALVQDSNGFNAKFGINAKYNTPAVLKKYGAASVDNLTQDQAQQIYKDRYWDKSGAANLPANLQTPFFDVYVRSEAVANKALAQSGNDPSKFLAAADALFKPKATASIQLARNAKLRDQLGSAASSPTVDVATTAPNPQLPPPSHQSFVDFNGYLAELPPTVDKTLAKTQGLRQVIAMAEDNNDPRLLNGLEFLAQKDGSSTFTPEEQSLIVEHRARIASMAEERADKQLRQTQSDNFGKFLTQFTEGNTPSRSSIGSAVQTGALAAEQGWALDQHVVAEQHQAAALQREDQRQANIEIDSELAPKIEEARTGSNAAAYTDQAISGMLSRGELGQGKAAASRALALHNAANMGIKAIQSSPEYAGWLAKIDTTFGTKLLPSNNGTWSLFSVRQTDPNYDPVSKAKILAEFKQLTDAGTPPAIAYSKAVSDQGKATSPAVKAAKTEAARQARIAELQNK